MDSYSETGSTADEKLESLASLGRIRAWLDQQDKLLEESNKARETAWNIINEDLRKLRADHEDSIEKLENFKEDTQTNFKDNANVHGNFGNRINALENAIAKLRSKMGK